MREPLRRPARRQPPGPHGRPAGHPPRLETRRTVGLPPTGGRPPAERPPAQGPDEATNAQPTGWPVVGIPAHTGRIHGRPAGHPPRREATDAQPSRKPATSRRGPSARREPPSRHPPAHGQTRPPTRSRLEGHWPRPQPTRDGTPGHGRPGGRPPRREATDAQPGRKPATARRGPLARREAASGRPPAHGRMATDAQAGGKPPADGR